MYEETSPRPHLINSLNSHIITTMPAPPPPPPSWALALSNAPPRAQKQSPIFSSSNSNITKSKSSSQQATTSTASSSSSDNSALLLKKSYELALAPAKSLPMTFISLYMSGSSLQIFSIVMVFMAFKNPIMGLLATFSAFERFETPETKGKLVMVRALYVLMQLVSLGVGVWKVNSMGLLP
jgi:hypothetical protein